MASTMEQHGRRVAEWRVSILEKGLNVNLGRSKVMVGSSGGKMIVNSRNRPCGLVVCLHRPMEGKGSHSNVQFFGKLTFPPHANSINKLQVMQNAVLRTATGCTQDTNIQHLHDETLILPIHEHLQLHASQYKQKAKHYL